MFGFPNTLLICFGTRWRKMLTLHSWGESIIDPQHTCLNGLEGLLPVNTFTILFLRPRTLCVECYVVIHEEAVNRSSLRETTWPFIQSPTRAQTLGALLKPSSLFSSIFYFPSSSSPFSFILYTLYLFHFIYTLSLTFFFTPCFDSHVLYIFTSWSIEDQHRSFDIFSSDQRWFRSYGPAYCAPNNQGKTKKITISFSVLRRSTKISSSPVS